MKVSVGLCTRDGAAFLPAQLASLDAQSRPPDEVVICDDASSDETTQILEQWLSATLLRVVFRHNSSRLGVTRNFEQAVSLCSGEVILLADQDDVLHPTKVATLAAAFERDPALACLFTDARRIAADGTPLTSTLWEHIHFTPREQQLVHRGHAIEVLARRNVATGATMAFRASWRHVLLPIPEPETMLHDRWTALVLAAAAKVDCLGQPLVDYREHSGQHTGAGKPAAGIRSWIEWSRRTGSTGHAARAAELRLLLERLEVSSTAGAGTIDDLRSRIAHLEVRAGLPPNLLRRASAVFAEARTGRYDRYSNHAWSIAKDVFRIGE